MPLYEYECERCAHRFEVIQRFSDPPLGECPKCGGPVRKLLSPPAIQFKGSGWYITDYARKASGAAKPAGTSGDGGEATGSKAADGSAESKPEGKPDSSEARSKPETKPAPKTETKAGKSAE